MKYPVILIVTLFFLKGTFSFAQTIDSLEKNGYDKLKKIIEKDNSNQKNTSLRSQAYLIKAKKENNKKEIIDGYFFVGRATNNLVLNLKYSDSAISIAKRYRPEDLSLLYWIRGCIYDDARNAKEALNCFLIANEYPKVSEELEDRINFKIGAIKSTQGKYDEAIAIYKKCERNAKTNNSPNYLRYVLGLSELYHRTDNISLSEEYVKKGMDACKNYNDGNFYNFYFISNRGKNYFKRGQYQRAITDLESPLKVIKRNDDFSNYAENCFYLGECYQKLHQNSASISYYSKVDSIFNARKNIYQLTITAYNRLIDYYKNQGDYKKVLYYSEQFIKADKVLDENYKYITDKISKNYDIQQVIKSKQDTISALKEEKIEFIIIVSILFSGIVTLFYLLFINKTKKNKELQKQKELFDSYIKEKEISNKEKDKSLKLPTRKSSLSNIDENVVKHIIDSLKKFEIKKSYLNNEYTIDSLSLEFKTNSNYLSKVINETKNTNFIQYINTLRIKYVLEKLETDKKYLNYTIQALSEMCGFNSVQTFTRAFANHTKMNPSDFIKELRNNNLQ
ncbi:helix-turn-helix domain-containing protein [Flavobacterium humi]|uniref:Helix-turn-helix domain-containing protein n=1 Tax=Flavobacterium humi TaxID=2562683 RepID=A0A4Z0L4X9_9FLAO|nr:helix-turn-helix domain-containing protein [Flavobacterium humi]TGD56761.1 helix-turn-helix domain-containing protein [Flavobacterium humi]